jgi:hypothetical protein
LEERVLREAQEKHDQEVKRLKKEKAELEESQAKELEEAKKQAAETAQRKAEEKAKEDLEMAVDAVKKETSDNAKQNLKLKEELDDQVKQLAELKEEKSQLRKSHEQELEDAKKQTAETAKKEAEEKIRKELESQISTSKEEAEAREKKNEELQEDLKATLKQMRELKDEKDKLAVDYEKQLLEDQDKIKQTAKKEAREELDLKMAEKDKKLQDAEKQILELQRKMQQGSQQLQGEVQELRLEEMLKEEFPFDEISEVPKGQGGADTIQVVRTRTGAACGTIVWESKRSKRFDQKWVQKLVEDQRAVKGDIAILVSNILPEEIRGFGMIKSIFVTDLQSAISVAYLLRQQLMKVHTAQVANSDKTTKAEVVYNYLISNEFKQRIEVWVEYFRERQEKINKERVYFNKKWQEEEKSIHKVIATTSGIYGDLQGLIGNALPKVSYLELPDSVEDGETE